MRVVYYLFPDMIGESVMVSDSIVTRDCEVALMMDKSDVGKNFYEVSLYEGTEPDGEKVDVTVPSMVIDGDGIIMTIPANNRTEAVQFALFVERKILELKDYQEERT